MNFSHYYDKLNYAVFPTVRSVNYMDKHNLKIGSIDDIYVKRKFIGRAKLIVYQIQKIKEMSLNFLRYDSTCDELDEIIDKKDYIDLLNSFLPAGWGHNRLTTTKAILWWRWILKNEN